MREGVGGTTRSSRSSEAPLKLEQNMHIGITARCCAVRKLQLLHCCGPIEADSLESHKITEMPYLEQLQRVLEPRTRRHQARVPRHLAVHAARASPVGCRVASGATLPLPPGQCSWRAVLLLQHHDALACEHSVCCCWE